MSVTNSGIWYTMIIYARFCKFNVKEIIQLTP